VRCVWHDEPFTRCADWSRLLRGNQCAFVSSCVPPYARLCHFHLVLGHPEPSKTSQLAKACKTRPVRSTPRAPSMPATARARVNVNEEQASCFTSPPYQ
jgi:hypothetical protein